jgi:hypothetical protein
MSRSVCKYINKLPVLWKLTREKNVTKSILFKSTSEKKETCEEII